MAPEEIKAMFDTMRAQIVGFEGEIAALKKAKGSAEDKKINADLIVSLQTEIAAIRGEMAARKTAPVIPAAKPEEPGIFEWIFGKGE